MSQVPQGSRTQRGQRACEPEHVVELLDVTLLSPQLVVSILGPSAAVHAERLDVAERIRGYPHAVPGWRNRKHPDPGQRIQVGDLSTRRLHIPDCAPNPDSPDAWQTRVTAMKTRNGGGHRVVIRHDHSLTRQQLLAERE